MFTVMLLPWESTQPMGLAKRSVNASVVSVVESAVMGMDTFLVEVSPAAQLSVPVVFVKSAAPAVPAWVE
jgi:hypothetical protein